MKELSVPVLKTYDYEALMKEFGELVGDLMQKNPAKYAPEITHIVEKYLGKGKKFLKQQKTKLNLFI